MHQYAAASNLPGHVRIHGMQLYFSPEQLKTIDGWMDDLDLEDKHFVQN